MKKLKSPFVVEYIDSWIEENTIQFKAQLSSNISSSHRILDPKNTVLLHIQILFKISLYFLKKLIIRLNKV